MGHRHLPQMCFLFAVSIAQSHAATANLRRTRARAEALRLFPAESALQVRQDPANTEGMLGADPSALKVPQCTCGCCHVAYRMPDEMAQDGTVFLKCALDEVQSHGTAVQAAKKEDGQVTTEPITCQETCLVPQDNKPADPGGPPTTSTTVEPEELGTHTIVNNLNVTAENKSTIGMPSHEEKEHPIDYNRYCLFHCRPYDFTVGNICLTIPEDQQDLLGADNDPGMQPAITDPAYQLHWDRATGVSPKPVKAKPATSTPLPCEKSDPCAFKLMDAAIVGAKAAYENATATAGDIVQVAGLLR